MRFILLTLCLNFISAVFSQSDTIPKIDLNIIVSNQEEGTPVVNAKVILVGSDGLNRIFYTDANGRVDVLHKDSLCIKPGNTYTIKVEGVLKQYLGTSDAFSTKDITVNTRLVRDLRIMQGCRGRMRLPVIAFESNSFQLSSSMKDSLNYMLDFMIEHPNAIIELGSIYNTANEKKLAAERAEAVLNYMVEEGIQVERFSIVYVDRPSSGEKISDITFKILSFDYFYKTE